MRINYNNCILGTGSTLDQNNIMSKPNPGLIELCLMGIKTPDKKNDIIMVGSCAGLPGQSGIDKQMALNFGIEYVDINQLINSYY